jgi:hypothetical protein
VTARASAHAGGKAAVRAARHRLDAGFRRRHRRQQQAWHDRGGVPGFGQVDLKQQIGTAVADVWLEAGLPAGVARPLARRCVRRIQDPRHAGQVGQPDGRVRRAVDGIRPVVGKHQEELVVREQLGAGAGHRRPRDPGILLAQDDVELVRQQAGERRSRLLVGDLDSEPRVAFGELGQHRRRQGDQDRLERGDPQGAAHLLKRGPQLGLGLLEPLEDRVGVADEDPRLRGKPDAAPGWLEQRHPGLGLELAELL